MLEMMRSLRFTSMMAAAHVALLLAGCQSAWYVRDPQFAEVIDSLSRAASDADPTTAALSPVVSELAGPHPVEHYIDFALAQNPDIQAARKQVEAAAFRVPQAASLSDPMVGVTAFAFSTFAITLGGEIIPRAYFSRNALRMADLMSPLPRL